MPTVHADVTFQNNDIGSVVQLLINLGHITDANVAAANTVDGLIAAVLAKMSAATNHGDNDVQYEQARRALESARETGVFTDALINPLTTAAGLLALTPQTNTSAQKTGVNVS